MRSHFSFYLKNILGHLQPQVDFRLIIKLFRVQGNFIKNLRLTVSPDGVGILMIAFNTQVERCKIETQWLTYIQKY